MENAKIESGRAEFALAEVKRVLAAAAKEDEYKAYCKKFPSIVMTNGLAAAFAFAMEKKGTWCHIYDHSEKWLKELKLMDSNNNLMDYTCGLSTAEYRVVTKEIIALFSWIRRFASGSSKG